MGKAWGGLAAVAAVTTVVACGQAFTIAGDGGGDGHGTSDAAPDAPPSDGPPPDVHPRDAPPPDVPVEVSHGDAAMGCNNCLDPKCLKVAHCVLDSSGWTPVSFAPYVGTPPSCPDGYGSPNDVLVAGGMQTCGCTCGGGSVACDTTLADAIDFGTGSCSGASEAVKASGCSVLTKTIATGSSVFVVPIGTTTSPCTSIRTRVIPPESNARLCTPMTTGTGCPSGLGEACVPRPDPSLTCVAQAGLAKPCPTGFQTTTYNVAPDFTDGRDCTACSCTPMVAGSCVTTAAFYSDLTCGPSTPIDVVAGTCTTLPGISTPIASVDIATASKGGGCGNTGSMASGIETPSPMSSGQTVCCR